MVLPDGSAKGLRTILQERGIHTVTLNADDMRKILSNFAKDTGRTLRHQPGFSVFFSTEVSLRINPHRAGMGAIKAFL